MLSIVLTVIGLAAIVIFSKHVYSSSTETGRNAGLLVFINILLGLTFQWIFPFLVMIAIVIIIIVRGVPVENFEEAVGFMIPLIISVLGIALSALAMMQVLKYASKVREDDDARTDAPPPPPTF